MRHSVQTVLALLLLAGTCAVGYVGLQAEDKPAAAEAAKVEGKGSIVGMIVDAAGKPVGGAQVTLYRIEAPTGRWGRLKTAGGVATTNKTGAYRFQGLPDDYFVVSVENEGAARAFRNVNLANQASERADIVLKPPVAPVISIVDPAGKPVVGATVREYRQRGVNGECRFTNLWLNSLGIAIPPSDNAGRLKLPPLPSGDVVKVTIDHSTLAPQDTEYLAVGPETKTSVTMEPGVTVTLCVPVDKPGERITGSVIDLRRQPDDGPSTIMYIEAPFDSRGEARLCVAPNNFSWLLLQHEDFFLTPVYSANYVKKNWLRIEPGRNQELNFDVRRKVTARGRVVDGETGKPLPGISLMGELANGTLQGWDDRPLDKWSFAGWGETDAEGRYTIALAAGSARVSPQGNEYLPELEHYELSVAADGSTVIPEIKLRPLQKIVGLVQNPDGAPAVRAVVRLRGKSLGGLQPVLTDADGRFEILPQWIPLDHETGERAFDQSVVAFDPYRPLASRGAVRLDKPEEVVLRLEPHDPGWLLSEFSSEMTDWARGNVEPAEAARYSAISLRGKSPPELDCVLWLNTGDRPLKLADLRGKYVLLDFWYTACGPCHVDFPSVKLVHELYKDKGVVVIGVHRSAGNPEAVRAHVAKIGLPFPVVLDHPDGRTISRFEPHGVPHTYPCYVLISPEGKVLFDDRTIPSPTLRAYKLEIIRRLLLESESARK